jgi:HK97 family phage prohead protease
MHKRADDICHSSPVLLLKRADTEAGKITGYGAVFGTIDLDGDVIAPGAFAQSIKERPSVPLLRQHRQDAVLGRVDRMTEDGFGLLIEASINRDTAAGREALANLKARDIDGLSIGFRAIERDGGVLKAVALYELSLVAIPAQQQARVLSVKSAGYESKLQLRKHLSEGGISRSRAEKAVEAAWPIVGAGVSEDADDAERCVFCTKSLDEVRLVLFRGEYCCDGCVRVLSDGLDTLSLPLNDLRAAIAASTRRWSK